MKFFTVAWHSEGDFSDAESDAVVEEYQRHVEASLLSCRTAFTSS
jgi:hypothetical protein